MKKYIILLVSIVAFMACNDDNELLIPTNRGTVTDSDGNVYEWVRIGNLDWTTTNAKNGSPLYELTYYDGLGYADAFTEEEAEDLKENYMPVYGNLMTFADAMASPPDGWRLPTDEDWQTLERAMGMGDETNNKGWRGEGVADKLRQDGEGAEMALLHGGICTWKAVFGWMELEMTNFKEFGYYWTSTIDLSYEDIEAAYYRKLCFGVSSIERQCGKTDKLMSVRWVRDAK